MTSYISLDTALQMLSNTYMASVLLLLAVSYFGLVAIETMEDPGNPTPKPKWFI